MMYLKKVGVLLMHFLPHFNIAMAFTLLTLFVTDRFNRAMAFINNDITKWMLAVFCITVVIEAIHLSAIHRKAARERNAAIDAAESKNQANGDS